MKRGGVTLDYHPQPEAGHNTAWWPEMKDTFETFAREHPRNPLPDVLTWETGRTDAGNRAHWLVIDKLGTLPGDAASARRSERHGDAAVAGLRRADRRRARHPGHRRIERASGSASRWATRWSA